MIFVASYPLHPLPDILIELPRDIQKEDAVDRACRTTTSRQKPLLLAHIHSTFSLATRTGRSMTRIDSQRLEMKLTANRSSQLSDQLSSARFAYQSRVSERSRTATNGGCKDNTSNWDHTCHLEVFARQCCVREHCRGAALSMVVCKASIHHCSAVLGISSQILQTTSDNKSESQIS